MLRMRSNRRSVVKLTTSVFTTRGIGLVLVQDTVACPEVVRKNVAHLEHAPGVEIGDSGRFRPYGGSAAAMSSCRDVEVAGTPRAGCGVNLRAQDCALGAGPTIYERSA
jgi:hypothetical protein